MLEDLLEAVQPHRVFLDQASFYKLLMHILISEPATSPYPAEPKLIPSADRITLFYMKLQKLRMKLIGL